MHYRIVLSGQFLFLLFFAAIVSAAIDDSPNLIENPGFELVDDDNITLNWINGLPPSLSFISISSDIVHLGTHAWVGLQHGSRCGYSDPIAVEPGGLYLLSAWLKSQYGSEQINFGWQEYDAADHCISTANWLLNNETVTKSWQQLEEARHAGPNTVYVKVFFIGPLGPVGTVWIDDVNLVKLNTPIISPVGVLNDTSSYAIDFGSANEASCQVQYNCDSMGPKVVEEDIDFRQILPNNKLQLAFPAFNIDANGFPLSPMLLEIHFKDAVDSQYHTLPGENRALVYSRIDFFNLDSQFQGYSDKSDICIASLDSNSGGNWKYMQYVFVKTQFQLLRAVDGKFNISIEMPEASVCYLPIDYVTLTEITQSESTKYTNKQRQINGFMRAVLPLDSPISESNYADLTIFSRDIMRPIYKSTKPSQDELTTVISSFSARGEVEPLNFAIYSENGIDDLSFEITDLINQQTSAIISKSHVEIFHVVYDEKRLTPYALKKRYALIPDRLEKISSVAIDPQTSERFWLKVNIPAEAEEGLYDGSIIIMQNGLPIQTITASLNVLPINLDQPQNINPLYHDPYAKVYCSDSNEVFKLISETGFDPFVYLIVPHLKPIVLDGIITDFNSSNFEASLDMMIQNGTARDIVLIETYNTWWEIYRTVFGDDAVINMMNDPNLYYKLSDRRFVKAFRAAIRKYQQIAAGHIQNNQQKPERNLLFVYSAIDEPIIYPNRRIIAERLYRIIHHENCLTTVTYEDCDTKIDPGSFSIPQNNGFGGKIPPLSRHIDYRLWTQWKQGAGFEKSPKQYGYYTTVTSYLRNPVYNRFLHGVLAFRTNASIVAAYAFGDFVGDPFNDFDAESSRSDSYIYPDFIFAYPTWSGKLLPTMNLEGIREGIKDAKYITTLKRLIGNNPNTFMSIEAGNYLAALKQRINPDYTGAYIYKSDDCGFYKPIIADLSESNDANDFESFTKIRQTIADYIISLAGDIGENSVADRKTKFLSVQDVNHSLAITRLTVKAGKIRASLMDSFIIQGTFDIDNHDIADGNTIYLSLRSANEIIFEDEIVFNPAKLSKNRYCYKGGTGAISSAVFDLNQKKFTIAANKVDLTGLSSPVDIELEWGNYRGKITADENIINGRQLLPMKLLSGYADAMCIEKASVYIGRYLNSDSLKLAGSLAVKSTVDLSNYSLTLHWQAQDFVVPTGGLLPLGKGKYRYVTPKGTVNELMQAVIDLTNCKFSIKVRKTTVITRSGVVDCGIAFGQFEQAVECQMP